MPAEFRGVLLGRSDQQTGPWHTRWVDLSDPFRESGGCRERWRVAQHTRLLEDGNPEERGP